MAAYITKIVRKLGFTPLLKENFNVSIKSILSSRLRSTLTIMIIAIGITSLIGILTATDSLKALMKDNFGKMGANSFAIRSQCSDFQSGVSRSRVINR
jgi:putative ABC transport system permease protein